MARRITHHSHSGAGYSTQYNEQQDPQGRGHWYKLRDKDIENPDGSSLRQLWKEAIKNPGKKQEATWVKGVGPGSIHLEIALYDPEKRMMLAKEGYCPNEHGHHLYQTCWCCGQYG